MKKVLFISLSTSFFFSYGHGANRYPDLFINADFMDRQHHQMLQEFNTDMPDEPAFAFEHFFTGIVPQDPSKQLKKLAEYMDVEITDERFSSLRAQIEGGDANVSDILLKCLGIMEVLNKDCKISDMSSFYKQETNSLKGELIYLLQNPILCSLNALSEKVERFSLLNSKLVTLSKLQKSIHHIGEDLGIGTEAVIQSFLNSTLEIENKMMGISTPPDRHYASIGILGLKDIAEFIAPRTTKLPQIRRKFISSCDDFFSLLYGETIESFSSVFPRITILEKLRTPTGLKFSDPRIVCNKLSYVIRADDLQSALEDLKSEISGELIDQEEFDAFIDFHNENEELAASTVGDIFIQKKYGSSFANFNKHIGKKDPVRSDVMNDLLDMIQSAEGALHYFEHASSIDGDFENSYVTYAAVTREVLKNIRLFHWTNYADVSSLTVPVAKKYARLLDTLRKHDALIMPFLTDVCSSAGYSLFHPFKHYKKDLAATLANYKFKKLEDPNHTNSYGQSIQHIWYHPNFPITLRIKKNGQYSIGIVDLEFITDIKDLEKKLISTTSYIEFSKVMPVFTGTGGLETFFFVPAFNTTNLWISLGQKTLKMLWNPDIASWVNAFGPEPLGDTHLLI